MPRYDDRIKEEARVFFLQGMGYKTIANKLKEQYNNSIAHNTIKTWAKQGDWHSLLDKQRDVIKQETATNSTRSTIRNIKTLQSIQSKFTSQLDSSSSEIRAYEMVSVIRELQRLEGAKDLQDTLIQEIAEKMPEAMKKSGLSQEQINLVIRNWVEMVRDLE
jgi:predicted RND superfamily exporter protein